MIINKFRIFIFLFIPFITGLVFSSCQKEEAVLIPPTLSTLEATEITAKSARTGGNITDDGGALIIARGVVWSRSANPTIQQNEGITSQNVGTGTFASNLTNLFPKTTYYVKAYATSSAGTVYGNEIMFETLEGLTDIDGNVYITVAIGTQVWMAENLKTTKYSNGDPIGTTQPVSFNITDENTPKYQWPADGNESNVSLFGRLYTWHVVNDSRNVCPTGWHVPTEAEWTTMENYLIASGFNYDNTTNGNKIAKSLASDSGWSNSSTEGAVGNTDFAEKRNSSGFSALPAGIRYSSGNFDYMGSFGYWRSAGDVDETSAWSHYLYHDSSISQRIIFGKKAGFSVRCVKD
jgi:uncharacterized protein (TIGR02145 family)